MEFKSAFSAYKEAGLIKPVQKRINKTRSKNKTNQRKRNQNGFKKNTYQNGGHVQKNKTQQLDKKLKNAINLEIKNQFTVPPISTTQLKNNIKTEEKANLVETANLKKKSVNHNKPTVVKVPETRVNNNNSNKTKKLSSLPVIVGNSSIDNGQLMFRWVLAPTTLDNFFKSNWEKKHLLLKRNNPNYYSTLLSSQKIDKMLRQNRIEFTKNIDITSYDEEGRKTHNPEGRALPGVVWDYYKNGCSIRLLNPQTYISQIHNLTATLQEYFQCMTGTNVYLTPPNSQGFAPHYDDIEAFVIQIEGKKRWKLYKPLDNNEILPRLSSKNFAPDEIGEPFLDVLLEPGDLLYFPRGVIHQACTVPDHHSLHLTLSVYQKNSWGDLMESLVPVALAKAINTNVEFRQGLPMNIGQFMGLAFSNKKSPQRTEAIQKVKSLFDKLFENATIDDAVDEMQKKFQHDAMPPDLTVDEVARTVYGVQPTFNADGSVEIANNVTNETRVRLLRANILRLVREDDRILIYYSCENSKEYHEFEPKFLEIDEEDAMTIHQLIQRYPKFVSVSSLPTTTNCDIGEDEKRLNIVMDLWEQGLLMTEDAL